MLVAGIVVAIIGVVLLVFLGLGSSTSVVIPSFPGAEAVSPPPTIGGIPSTLTVSWSGAAAGTTVYIYECKDAACSSLGSNLASGHGSSGTLSIQYTSGTTYAITESGTSGGVSGSFSLHGLLILGVVGIALIVVGALLAGIGWRRAPKVREVAPPPEEAAGSELIYGAETQRPAAISPESEAAVPMSVPMPEHATETESAEMTAPAPPPRRPTDIPQTGPGSRPPIQCRACNTWNEPWLVNCRWCHRPLTTTGG